MNPDQLPSLPVKKVSPRIYVFGAASILFILAVFIFVQSRAPASFVPNTLVHINKNSSLSSIAMTLKKEDVIRSTYLFRLAVVIFGKAQAANAGDYFFQTAPTVWQVAYRVVHGEQGLTPVRATFPEGTSIRGMGVILGAALNAKNISVSSTSFAFSTSTFARLASTSEGYLFPDTYFFAPNVTPATIISTMQANFNQQIKSITALTAVAHRKLSDVVIMASILEKEALKDSDRRVIAGILWKRIDSGMALQIDPPFAYAIGKTSDALTLADLQVDSLYNTYRHKGLPPTPINNPGLEALTAAVNASSTPYWFYLSDKKGVIHYATTYDQHLANRAKYLGK